MHARDGSAAGVLRIITGALFFFLYFSGFHHSVTFSKMNTAVSAPFSSKKIQRQHTRFEQRRQTLLAAVNSRHNSDAMASPASAMDSNAIAQPAVASSSSAPRSSSLTIDQQEFQEQRDGAVARLKRVLSKTAVNVVTKTTRLMNPQKPSLEDVARMFLQDTGEKVSGRPLLPKEEQFIKDAHVTSVYIDKVREMYKDVEGTVKKRVDTINQRRQNAEQHHGGELTEHVTFTEYQKYMRKRGFLKDDREDVPEGNLIPILAVLQGQAEGVGFIKAQRKLLRIGDFVVEVDPNDPMFARYADGEENSEEEKRRLQRMYHNGKYKDAEAQTDVRDDDATDAEIAFVYRRLDECQSVIEALDKAKLDAELFCETALSRITGMRKTSVKMYDALEAGQATLQRLTAEAMSQNERLWRKLDALAQDQADDRAKKSINRTFTQQIERLNQHVASLKLMLESAELNQMQMSDDFHFQEALHVKKMEDLRQQVIPRQVKEELRALTAFLDHEEKDATGGGPSYRDAKTSLEMKIDVMSARSAQLQNDAGVPRILPFLVPSTWKKSVLCSLESAFGSLDEVLLQTLRHVFDMMMNPHKPVAVVEHIKEIRDVLKEVRTTSKLMALELLEAALESQMEEQLRTSKELVRLQQELAAAHADHQEALKKKEAEMSVQFQQRMNGAMPMELFEKEKQKAVAAEREKFVAQIGKEIPIPQIAVPSLGPAPTTIPRVLLQPSTQPQDLLHAAASYITEMVLEVCQVCTTTNQAIPPRVANAHLALQMISIAQDKVTTNEGLVDGIAVNIPGALEGLLARAGSPSSPVSNTGASESDAVGLAEKWWSAAASKPGACRSFSPLQKQQQQSQDSASDPAAALRRGFETAAAILKPSRHLSQANLSIRSRLADVVHAPESVVNATLAIAKEKASELRAEGVIRPKLVAAEDATNGQSPRSKGGKSKPQKGLEESASGNGVSPAASLASGPPNELHAPTITVPTSSRLPTVDRATSPIPQKIKKCIATVSATDTARALRAQLDERAARKARNELAASLKQQYQELHASLEYMRIALLAAMTDDPDEDPYGAARERSRSLANLEAISGDVAKLFSLQIREDREILEKMTHTLLSATDEHGPLERARSRYRAKAPKLGHRSRVRLFLSTGVDKGVTCDIVGGKEAILTSPEAIDYAILHDMKVFSNNKRRMDAGVALPSSGAVSQQRQQTRWPLGEELNPSLGRGMMLSVVEAADADLFCVDQKTPKQVASTMLPPLNQTAHHQNDVHSMDAIAVRRIVRNTTNAGLHTGSSQTPPPKFSHEFQTSESPSSYAYRYGRAVKSQQSFVW